MVASYIGTRLENLAKMSAKNSTVLKLDPHDANHHPAPGRFGGMYCGPIQPVQAMGSTKPGTVAEPE
jgi:hypothetical protein